MNITIDESSDTPIWEQIVQQVKRMVLAGTLGKRDRLESVRELSDRIGINKNTVAKAYQYLERQGIIETRRGRGTFVTETLVLQRDLRRERKIKDDLRVLLIEASYLGISSDTVKQWVDQSVLLIDKTDSVIM